MKSALHALVSGDPEPAIEYAKKHDIHVKSSFHYQRTLNHEEDARYVYPARMKLARKILEHNIE